MSSPPIAGAAMEARKGAYPIPLEMPISMFCGLPVTVIALPTFDAKASPRRYGAGRNSSDRSVITSTGVKTRQMVSLMKSAERMRLA